MQQTLRAVEDPALVNQMLSQALSDKPTASSADDMPTAATPPDLLVTLPFGYLDPQGGVHREAEVRELTGIDEEALARIPVGNIPRMLSGILERGVVRIGTHPVTPTLLDTLTTTDRDTLLVGIRRATYGDDVELEVRCGGCEATLSASISLTDDVPYVVPEDPDERRFTIALRAGTAVVRLPDGKLHKQLAGDNMTSAELNTVLIAGTLESLNGISLAGPSQARKLSMRDRTTLLQAIAKRFYGPQLNKVEITCPNCGQEIPLPLAMGDLFRL